MARDEIHVEDIGTVFELTIKDGSSVVDVSSATTKQISFEKPDGVVEDHAASFTTDGTDGKIRYATIAGDLDTDGKWKIQGKIILPSGAWHTGVDSFQVHLNLTD